MSRKISGSASERRAVGIMWELLVDAAGGAFITRRAVERQPRSAAVEGVDLLDPPGVPATLEGRGQEDVDDGGAQPGPGDPGPEAEHVGVVVGPGHARLVLGAAQGGPHAGELVGGDADADPGAADQQAEAGPAGAHRLADQDREVRVVDALRGERPEVLHLEAPGARRLDALGAQGQPGVIRGGDHLVGHVRPPPYTFLKSSTELVPPNPKLLEITTSSFFSRAVLGTTSSWHSGSWSSTLMVGGTTPWWRASTATTASRPPAAPSRWPVIDLVEETHSPFWAWAPQTEVMAGHSATSPCGVEVPWVLT